MQDWLKTFDGSHQPFPAPEIALKVGITVAPNARIPGFGPHWHK